MANKRLMDGQYDQCNLTLKELNQIEKSVTKTLCAIYHGRIAYPKQPLEEPATQVQTGTSDNAAPVAS